MLKRIISVLLSVALIATLAACGGGTAKKPDPTPVGPAKDIKNKVEVAKGKKPMEEGLDFKGKTFKLAIPFKAGDDLTRKVEAFNKKFNAKVEVTVVDWNQFNLSLATA